MSRRWLSNCVLQSVYSSTVDAMFEPYILPSEYGGREDTRWASLTSSVDSDEWPLGHGIFIEAFQSNTPVRRLVSE